MFAAENVQNGIQALALTSENITTQIVQNLTANTMTENVTLSSAVEPLHYDKMVCFLFITKFIKFLKY